MPCASCTFDSRTRLAACLGAAVLTALLSGATRAESATSARDVRLLSVSRSGESPAATVDALERAGYRVHVAIPPDAYWVSAGRGAGPLPAGVFESAPRPGSLASLVVNSSPAGAEAGGEGSPDPFGGKTDVLEPLGPGSRASRGTALAPSRNQAPGLPSGMFYGTRWEDTSEFMIGRVALSILFPESDGSTDPNRFDWTPALRDSVVRSAVRGLLKWSVLAASRDLPLTFLLEVRSSLSTRYEPIDRPIAQETLWMEDALVPLVGYRGDVATMAYEFANGARARLGAHWAGILFAVQNDTSSTGAFPDGFIAHARLGGPWFVLPVNNLNTQSATLDYYVEHEVTHLFWALDEYPAVNAWWSCYTRTGYFDLPNTNSDVPTPIWCKTVAEGRRCLMKGNYPDSFCVWTQAQIGWADRDFTGKPDFYETSPVAAPDSGTYHGSVGVAITVRGKANESALQNRNPYRFLQGDSISVATIDSIQYRLDGGPWTRTPCLDGACDFGEERFQIPLPLLAAGNHSLESRAWNTNGLTAAQPTTTPISISGTSGPVPGGAGGAGAPDAPRLATWPSPASGLVRATLDARPGARGRARVIGVSGRVVRDWIVEVPASGVYEWEWDPRRESGGRVSSGLYFIVVEIESRSLTRRVMVVH